MATSRVFVPTGLSDLALRPPVHSATLADTATLSAQGTRSPWGQRDVKVQCSVPNALWPEWARSAVKDLLELLNLRPGWDSYGGRPIDVKAVDKAVSLLIELMNDDSPAPAVVPTPMGGVQLEWHQRGIDLEIEVHPDGVPTVFGRDARARSEQEEYGLPGALPRIREMITQRRD